MRSIILAASLLVMAGAAYAADDPLASRYGNTVIATEADGSQTYLYFNADHTLSAKHGFWFSKGSWELKDDQLCTTYDTPRPGIGKQECSPATSRQVGDKWQGHGRAVKLVKGIVSF
jgi:hypothetical protein